MSNDIHKADQIAFHFYTKLFYAVNHARATEESNSTSRVDKWFNLETPDSDLFTKDAREPYRSVSLASAPGPPPLEIQVLLSVPELTNNQVLVYMSPDSSRVRIEPTPRFILLETWTLAMRTGSAPNQHGDASTDVALPIIYKHGIVLFRSVFSLLRVLPAWKFYKRLKRKIGGVNRNGHLGITLRVRSSGDSETARSILGFGAKPSPTYRSPLPTSTHTFPTVAHLLGSFTLSTTYLSTPNFQLDELESLLSSRFISLDLEGFIPTLDKNRQRDSISGSSSLPNSSGIRSAMSRSPPKPIGRAPSAGAGAASGATTADSVAVADRFILPTRVPSVGTSTLGTTASTGTSALIPPPRPFPTMNPSSPSITSTQFSNPGSVAPQPIPASGLAFNRLRKESMNSSSSSSMSTRDLPPPGPNQGTSSLSSSPVTGPLPIRRPNINPVHPFKSNTLSSASGSSPSLSIRQGAGAIIGGGSPVGLPSSLSGTGPPPHSHSRQPSSASPIGNPARLPPSPISGFSAHPSPPPGTTVFSPSSLGDRRPGTSGSGASSDRDRRTSMQSLGMGSAGGDSDDGRVPMGIGMPPRKRYSSSFGHRYVGSVGSGTGIAVGSASGTAGSNEGRTTGMVGDISMPGSGNVSGRATPASGGGQDGKKEGIASFLSTATDDDDISIFVQDIDSRKPLSGRVKEREKREELEEQERLWQYTHQGQEQEHDRNAAESTLKGKERERAPKYDIGAQDRRPLSDVFADDVAYTTSPPSLHPTFPHPSSDLDMAPSDADADAAAAERAAQFSTSPTRSPMLTSQNEVEERLKKMNETFLKSLEGISGGSTRRKDRRKDTDKDKGPSVPTSPATPLDREREREQEKSGREGSSSSSSSGNYPSRASRGLGLGFPSPRAGGAERDVYSPYPYNTPGLGLGLGRGRYASTSSSTLANSEAGASQGSEEVIGRMELYDERRRSGFHG